MELSINDGDSAMKKSINGSIDKALEVSHVTLSQEEI
jgi:hypothetical protein